MGLVFRVFWIVLSPIIWIWLVFSYYLTSIRHGRWLAGNEFRLNLIGLALYHQAVLKDLHRLKEKQPWKNGSDSP